MEKKGLFSEYKEQINEAIADLKTKGRRHKQIPNILTLSRLTAPAVIIPLTLLGNVPLTIGAIAAYGVTDLLDGIIARTCNLKSKLGADLDAFADKMFAGTLLLAASIANPSLLINVGLEMGIAGININQKAKGKEAASTLIGKAKTWALFALAGVGMFPTIFPATLLPGLALTTTIMQGLTVASYLYKYKKQEKKEKQEEQEITSSNYEIEESKNENGEKVLGKEKVDEPQPIQNNQLEQLREMRDTLLMEQRVTSEVTKEVQFQKRMK